jgi:uncharacterized membrane protein
MQLGGKIFSGAWMEMTFILIVAEIFVLVPGAVFSFMLEFGMDGAFVNSTEFILVVLAGSLLLMILFAGPFQFGIARVTVDCVEREYWGLGNVFHGFGRKFFSSILLDFMLNFFLTMWSLLGGLPGLVKSYSYSMAFYLRQDPAYYHLEASDCITESRRMMDGYKWQLFCLDFSFIGKYIVGALCFGIGILFVIPYHQLARANFYDALKASHMNAFPAAPISETRYK